MATKRAKIAMDASPSSSIRTTTPLPPTALLSDIPPAIVRTILRYAVNVFEQGDVPVETKGLHPPLAHIASVSKEWHTATLDASSQFALYSHRISIVAPTRSMLVHARNKLTLQRTWLRKVAIVKAEQCDLLSCDQWAALFAQVPRLEKLSLYPLKNASNRLLGAIVQAAGQRCAGVQYLDISTGNYYVDDSPPEPEDRLRLIRPLYAAMERWSKKNGGLRCLNVNMRHDLDSLCSTREYFTHVIDHCTQLEILNGFLSTVGCIDRTRRYEHWTMDVDLWTSFCRSLTRLKQFNWICVPFATTFFEIFGRFQKPQLTKLTLTAAVNWNWTKYKNQVNPATYLALKETGFGGDAKNVEAVLHACPNLQKLKIVWYTSRPGQSTKAMNPEIFGDTLCETLARECPHLTDFELKPAQDESPTNRPITSFTDRGMKALARMPWLRNVVLDAVNVTGDGVFALGIHHAAACQVARVYSIALGQFGSPVTDLRFYRVVVDFLTRLAGYEGTLPCSERSVTVTLVNKNKTPVAYEWSTQYMHTVKELIARIQTTHPTVSLNMFVTEYDRRGFALMEEFVFDTQEPPHKDGWMDNDNFIEMDDGVWVGNERPDAEDEHFQFIF